MSAYTFQLPHFSADADQAERALRGLDSTSAVNSDKSSETLTVNSSLSYGEVLDVLRQQGISAQ
ncbi:hypothetical protein ACFVUS_01725 [Nocardia sp. NPDC058058]|uniref:hypothetical protein n=1 Tax=Nocardia sp. NPDC058058 TaxID=3346317 RepID=UPI0036DF5496